MTQEISLEDAIEYIKMTTPDDDPWTMWDMVNGNYEPSHADKCIATILNAVVKGELKHAE